MNTYLFSIQPKWCEKIFNGEKTIEVRKTAPKPPFKVVVYCTKGNGFLTRYLGDLKHNKRLDSFLKNTDLVDHLNGKVIGEFICERVSKYSDADLSYFEFARELNGIDKYPIENGACLTIKQMHEYSNKGISAIKITAPILYDKPKELGEFYSIKQCKPEYSPFGYQWTWEDRHKRNTGGWNNKYRPVPIECHRCKSLVGGKDYLDEKSGCILFDYECISNYHKPLARPPQSYMWIQDPKEV